MWDALRRLLGRSEEDLPTPEKVAEVRKTFDEKLAEALERHPAMLPVSGLSPVTGHEAPCPRCGSRATTINFMPGAHEGCPDERMRSVRNPFAMLFEVDYDNIATNQRINEAAVQHHDRGCHNCGFGWVEATL